MFFVFFFFKQKTAYELRISDWSSDVCSSDLVEMFRTTADLTQQFGAADHLVEALDPEPGEDVADLLGHEGHQADDLFGGADELGAQRLVLRAHPHRAGRRMALEHQDADHSDEAPCADAVYPGPRDRGD